MSEIATFTTDGEVGIIRVDMPGVNVLGHKARAAIDEGIARFGADDAVKAIVLICGGRTFFAGADIAEFGKPPREPGFHELYGRVEASRKPVVAAIHGTALGGGLELALVCHYRVAAPSARFGLPEVHLGILPGAGGTQRLPRLVGVEKALDLMTSGRQMKAQEALDSGVVDALVAEDRLQEEAVAFAKTVVAEGRPLRRVRDLDDRLAEARGKPELFAEFRKAKARAFKGFKAPEGIVQAVEAAVALPFDEGIRREQELFVQLMTSPESAAQRYYFFAEREAAKIPDISADTPTLPVRKVGVIGAGTMGGGIAMNFLNAGIPVTLLDMGQESLDRGVGVIRRNYETTAKRGRLTAEAVEQRMSAITPTLDMTALADCDLVIEAVFESMDVKKQVFGRLDVIARQGAILASNTSYLDIDEIAASTSRPESVIGMHFFSPANVMPLLEVVRGAKSANEVVATAMKLGKAIGKVAVLSRVCNGFIANRLLLPRFAEAEKLVLSGVSPQDVDRVLQDYGFAVGQFAMMDIVGLDVIGRDAAERTLFGDFVKAGRLGQKNGRGFYDYDENRRATPSAEAQALIADYARHKGAVEAESRGDEDILHRLLFPVVNEGARILEEGIAIRASDIDVAAINGYNWPVYTGGPMHWAGAVGLPEVAETLRRYQSETGDPSYAPAALLERKAGEGGGF